MHLSTCRTYQASHSSVQQRRDRIGLGPVSTPRSTPSAASPDRDRCRSRSRKQVASIDPDDLMLGSTPSSSRSCRPTVIYCAIRRICTLPAAIIAPQTFVHSNCLRLPSRAARHMSIAAAVRRVAALRRPRRPRQARCKCKAALPKIALRRRRFRRSTLALACMMIRHPREALPPGGRDTGLHHDHPKPTREERRGRAGFRALGASPAPVPRIQ